MPRVLLTPGMVAVHLLALAAVGIATWLGLWQYEAWDFRRDAAAVDLADEPPVPLAEVMRPDDPYPGDAVGRPVRFEASWVEGETFFVAEREYAGESGFWVVTPAAVCADECRPDGPAMLVVRGWTPSTDAPVPPATGTVMVRGWLQPPEGSGRQDPDPDDDVLHELRIADALQRVDQDLYGGYVIADRLTSAESPGRPADATAGLEPVTPESLPEPTTFTAWRNLLYAFEWWLFGAFAGFLWWRWCRDQLEAPRPSEPVEHPEVASRP